MVFLTHPDLAAALLLEHRDHGDLVRNTEPAQGRGITLQEGEEWRRTRRLVADLFAANRIAEFTGPIAEAVLADIQALDVYADSGTPLNLSAYIGNVTLRVLFKTMFSDAFDSAQLAEASSYIDDISFYKSGLMSKDMRPEGAPSRTR